MLPELRRCAACELSELGAASLTRLLEHAIDIHTMVNQVLKTVDNLKKQEVSEADIVNVETLISEATSAIDKGIGKGVIKANTGARRKSRMSLAKQRLLIEKGLYTPTN